MCFVCPDCTRRTLQIQHRMELGPTRDDDELTVQTLACNLCAYTAVAIYRESRRGASDSFHHHGYPVAPADYAELQRALGRCPAPGSHHCTCEVHGRLRGAANVLQALPIQPDSRFRLKR